MTPTYTLKNYLIWIAAVAITCTATITASAMDTFLVNHESGPCSSVPFEFGHKSWAGRSRISLARGEKIRIKMYGHGADLATDATGSDIFEWIHDRGRDAEYPNAPLSAGQRVPKGFVIVDIKADSSHSLGNHTVKVHWLIGSETIKVRIVNSCNALKDTAYRPDPDDQPTSGSGTGGLVANNPAIPNLLPYVFFPVVLTRPIGQPVVTNNGRMSRLPDSLCSGLSLNVVTGVPIPTFTWGVAGVNIEQANTQFEVSLLDLTDANNPRTLGTLNLPQGFPANTPVVRTNNYPNRPTTIRVVRNPTLGGQTFSGCFTEPNSNQLLDPAVMAVRVDPTNRINEQDRENDNELRVP